MGTVLRPGRSGCTASSGSPESIRLPLIEAGNARRRSPDGAKFISPWDEFRPAFARQPVRLPEPAMAMRRRTAPYELLRLSRQKYSRAGRGSA